MQQVFDSALQETAQRLLPLAVLEIVNREAESTAQHLAPIRAHDELFTYIVRDASGAVLMKSHAADPGSFPAWSGTGFVQTATHRFYGEDTLQGSIRLTVAEPLAIRQQVMRGILMRQAAPLLLALPLTLVIVWIVVRLGLRGIRRFRNALATRDASELAPVPTEGLPAELLPVAQTLDRLLARLSAAFEAERSFAAHAAHELRTPLAGAIAQAQRIAQEAPGAQIEQRAAAIEETLKRLSRTAERLMQLARAEGGRLKVEPAYDVRPVLRLVIDDLRRSESTAQLRTSLPDTPVLTDLDPDALAIVARNLIDNAVRHGSDAEAVQIELSPSGTLTISNACAPIAASDLAHLTERFTRMGTQAGSGLGLAIVGAIAQRTGAWLQLASPAPGRSDGFCASVQLPRGRGATIPIEASPRPRS